MFHLSIPASGICLGLAINLLLPQSGMADNTQKAERFLLNKGHLDPVIQTRLLAENDLAIPSWLAAQMKSSAPGQFRDGRQGGEDFASATVIDQLPFSDTGTTAGAANDIAPGCGFSSAPDLVYAYTPAADVTVDADLCGSSFDTILGVFEGPTFENFACNVDFCGDQSAIEFMELVSGTTYYFVVDGVGSNSGDYSFNLDENQASTPCETFDAGYTIIESLPFSSSADIAGTADIWGSSGTEFGFELTLAELTPVRFLTCQNGNTLDSRIYILDAHPCEEGTSELQNNTGDASCGFGVSVDYTAVLTAGTYVILAGSDFAENSGNLNLTIEEDVDWMNPCDTAVGLFCGDDLALDNTGAADFYNSSAGDLLFEFTLDDFANIELGTCSVNTEIDTKLYLFDTCPFDNSVDYIAYNDDWNGCEESGLQSMIVAGLDAGSYFVIVTGFGGDEGAVQFSFNCTSNNCPVQETPFILSMLSPEEETVFVLTEAEILPHFSDPDLDDLTADPVEVIVTAGFEGTINFDVIVSDGQCDTEVMVQLGVAPLDSPFNLEAELNEDTGEVDLTWNFFEDLVFLSYDNDVITDSYTFEGSAMSTHMSPAAPCRIMALAYYTLELGDSSEFMAEIYGWGGFEPDTTMIFARPSLAADGDWIFVETWMDDLVVEGDFVVGFGSINGTAALGFDANLDNGRSWDYDHAGNWSSWTEAYAIRAVVQYVDSGDFEVISPVSHPYTERMAQVSEPRQSTPMVIDLPESSYNSSSRDFIEFNVYRNGVSLGMTSEMVFADQLPGGGFYEYAVTAIFDEGESEASMTGVDWMFMESPRDLDAVVNTEDGGVELEWRFGPEPTILAYDNDTSTGSYTYDGAAMSTQMSPDGPCQLVGLAYLTTGIDFPFNAEIYGWTGSAPDTTQLYTGEAASLDNDWVIVELFEEDLFFEDDFMVGFGSINADAGLAFDANLDNGRSWDYDHAGTWESWNEAYMIRALVFYEGGPGLQVLSPVGQSGRSNGGPMMDLNRIAAPFDAEVPALHFASASRDFIEFNVWRDGALVGTTVDEFYVDLLPGSGSYTYWITANYDEGESDPSESVVVDWDGVDVVAGMPHEFYLKSVYPNPFNPSTRIDFGLPREQAVVVEIFNLAGQRVAQLYNGRLPAGNHHLTFNAAGMASGVYFMRMTADNVPHLQKMTLLK